MRMTQLRLQGAPWSKKQALYEIIRENRMQYASISDQLNSTKCPGDEKEGSSLKCQGRSRRGGVCHVSCTQKQFKAKD